MVKNPPAMWETWVRSLGWEDSLQKGMATHSSIFAWRIPWTEEPGRLQFMGSQRVRHDWVTFTFIKEHLKLQTLGWIYIYKGNEFNLWWKKRVISSTDVIHPFSHHLLLRPKHSQFHLRHLWLLVHLYSQAPIKILLGSNAFCSFTYNGFTYL